MVKIDVLLATYNGAAYLPAQISSIMAQTRTDFRVLVRDDGSTDATLDILHTWQAQHPDRVVILETGQPSGGAMGNFARLLAASDADYVLFADQDDVWAPTKLEFTLNALLKAETEIGRTHPVLAFCDLAVVDRDGTLMNPSFRAFQGMDAVAGSSFHRLLLENTVTGCASGINAAARQLCADIPPQAIMHDWWLALVCAGLGRIVVMPNQLIAYRQHGGNAVGAKPWSAREAVLTKLRSRALRANQERFRAWMRRLYGQAHCFQARHGSALCAADRATLADFLALERHGAVTRRMIMVRRGFRLSGVIRTIGLYLRA